MPGGVAEKGAVPFLSAALLTAPQHYRKALERIESTMVKAQRLYHRRFLILSNRINYAGSRKKPVHQFLNIQNLNVN